MELTRKLVEAARENGIEVLYAEAMHDNDRMLSLLRDLGLPERSQKEGGKTERVEIEL